MPREKETAQADGFGHQYKSFWTASEKKHSKETMPEKE